MSTERWILVLLLAWVLGFSLIFLSTVHVSAATFSSSLTAEGLGAIHVNQDTTMVAGQDLQNISHGLIYNEINAGHSIVTAPGSLQYQKKDTVDSRASNRYNGTGYSSFSNGGVVWDSLAMSAITPNVVDVGCDAGNLQNQDMTYTVGANPSHQYIDSEVSGFAYTGEFVSAKYANDADYTFSPQGQWDGAGLYTGDTFSGVHIGGDKNTTEMNYESSSHTHFVTGSNQTGGMRVRPDWGWQDFSNSFVTTDYNLTNKTVNST